MLSETFGDSPIKGDIPPAFHDRVTHATLKLPPGELIASEACPWAPPKAPVRSCGLSLPLSDVDGDGARKAFDALTEGDKVTSPLDKSFGPPRSGRSPTSLVCRGWINCDTPDASGS